MNILSPNTFIKWSVYQTTNLFSILSDDRFLKREIYVRDFCIIALHVFVFFSGIAAIEHPFAYLKALMCRTENRVTNRKERRE